MDPQETPFANEEEHETLVAKVAEIDPDELIVGYDAGNEAADEKDALTKIIEAGTVASHVVALGASKAADVAGPMIARGVEMAAPVVEKGAKSAAKGAVKLGAFGLQSLGKGLNALGNMLKPQENAQEQPESEYQTIRGDQLIEGAQPQDALPLKEVSLPESGTQAADEAEGATPPDSE